MLIACVADLHIWCHKRHGGVEQAGMNERGKRCVLTLRAALETAERAEVDDFFILGDVFDQSNPTPQLLSEVMLALRLSNMRIHILAGNHDIVSNEQGDHALGPLEHVMDNQGGGVNVYSGRPRHFDNETIVPYVRQPMKTYLPEVFAGRPPHDKPGWLLMHAGIEVDETKGFLSDANDSIHVDQLVPLCKENNISAVFAGNWHKPWSRKIDGVWVVQCGTLIPAGHDDDDVRGYVWFYDTESGKVDRKEIPGPRFYTIDAADIPKIASVIANEPGWPYYRVRATREQAAKIPDLLAAVSFSVDLDRSEEKEAAREAATVTRAAPTIDAAVAAYVEEMQLEPGATREAVLERAKSYLNR